MTRSFTGPLRRHWGGLVDAPSLQRLLVPTEKALDLGLEPGGLSPAARRSLDANIRLAHEEADSAWPQPLASDFARYFDDGNRTIYQEQTWAREQRLARAVLAWLATNDEDLLREVLNGVIGLCEQSTWCWPAHDDVHERNGWVLTDVTRPFLDLGASEVVALLAWTDAVVGPTLEAAWPGVRERVRHEARRRVLDPFLVRRDWHWLGLDGDVHNWSPWIQSNVIVAALRLEADEARRSEIVARAIEGLDRYVAALPADGAIDEGSSYWWNGAGRLLEGLELLAEATGGALDASGIAPLAEVVAFPHRMHLGGPWSVSFADAQARSASSRPWRTLFHWARRIGDDEAEAFALTGRDDAEPIQPPEGGLGRRLRAVADEAWLHARARSEGPLPASVWLPSIQVSLDRPAAHTSAGLALVIKGGHNNEHHNHNDVGSIIVALDGVPIVVDAGQPTYTARSFSPRRYEVWTNRSDWHSVPLIGGREQHAGPHFRAESTSRIEDDGGARGLVMDLSAAYGLEEGTWQRHAVLGSDGSITLTDSWTRTIEDVPESAGTLERLLLAGDVVVVEDGRVLVTPLGGGRRAVITWSDADSPEREERVLDDPLLCSSWGEALTRLSWRVADTAEPGTFTVTIGVES
ncbi:heparinase II/III family protein [Actinomyces sp. MRS3W]|uniref:heparinase II/III family protein n=1 Tax=Actinomyces sp. MRS3W TaxID=2800796 RepID=UPI0028FD0C36|nr:heparinase II/III family protein [Actinomyces sp. MRS3W]MDU0348914.1 heparinase II/III family protein [Actinomyces sp. MRS3W]